MYRENKNFGFGDLAIGNKGKNDFLINVNSLLDWDSIEKILKLNLKRGFNAIGYEAPIRVKNSQPFQKVSFLEQHILSVS